MKDLIPYKKNHTYRALGGGRVVYKETTEENCKDVIESRLSYLRTSAKWLFIEEQDECKQELKDALEVALSHNLYDLELDTYKIMAIRLMIDCNLATYKEDG